MLPLLFFFFFFFNDTATTEIYTLSLHDALRSLQAAYANLHTDQERDYFMQRYHDVITFLVIMLICILTKNVITSCSVTMMLFLHLEVKPLMTLTTVLYLSCALISGHLAMMLMELTKRR